MSPLDCPLGKKGKWKIGETCKKGYSWVSLLTKLKYIGTQRKDLIDIYKLFIRSTLEYCSLVYHFSLTDEQSQMLENVQAVCLKFILGSDYTDRQTALTQCSLQSLKSRRESRIKDFCAKALAHPVHRNMFPKSPKVYT